MAKYDDIKPE